MNDKLSVTTVALHWIVGLCFIAIFAVGIYMTDLPKGPDKFELYGLHKSFGVLILLVALPRFIWRIKEGMLPPVGHPPAWQERLAKLVALLLLIATLLMPISGMLMSVGGGHGVALFGLELIAKGDKIEWMSSVGKFLHKQSVDVIIVGLALHIGGALKHHFLDKDDTLKRMLKG